MYMHVYIVLQTGQQKCLLRALPVTDYMYTCTYALHVHVHTMKEHTHTHTRHTITAIDTAHTMDVGRQQELATIQDGLQCTELTQVECTL